MGNKLTIMAKHKLLLLPSLKRQMRELGENIRLARLRRRFSATMIAERAGITRTTLRAIERGEASVAMGAYASVLLALGLEKELKQIGKDDELGRKIQDAALTTKARAPRIKRDD